MIITETGVGLVDHWAPPPSSQGSQAPPEPDDGSTWCCYWYEWWCDAEDCKQESQESAAEWAATHAEETGEVQLILDEAPTGEKVVVATTDATGEVKALDTPVTVEDVRAGNVPAGWGWTPPPAKPKKTQPKTAAPSSTTAPAAFSVAPRAPRARWPKWATPAAIAGGSALLIIVALVASRRGKP